MSESGGRETYDDAISRRKMLALAGASGMAALAGCGGDETPTQGEGEGTPTQDGEGTPSPDEMQVYDKTYNAAYTGNPAELHFNVFNPESYSWPAGRSVFAPYMKYSFTNKEFKLGALDDLQVNSKDQEVILTFRDDLTWDNGKDVTTQDITTQLELEKKTEGAIWGYLEGYEVMDEAEMKIRLNLSGQTHPRIIKFQLTGLFVCTPHEVFGEFLDKEASEVLSWAYDEDVRSSAMWSFLSKGQQQFKFERNEEFYNAGNVNFNEFLIERFGGNTAQHQALMSAQEIDAAPSLFTPPNIVKQFPDRVEEVNIPAKWGYGVVFNHEDPVFGKRKVRQAVAHAINRQALVENAGPRTKFPSKVPCGIAPRDQEYWLKDWMGDFETYGVDESQTEQAAQLMKDAGYTKKGGKWRNEKGNPIGGEYYTPAGWTDWTTMTQTTVSQLNEFGFDFSIATAPTSDWQTTLSKSNFRMSGFYWLPGGSRSAFPYFPLRYQLMNTHIGGGHNYRPIAKSEQTIPAHGGGETTLTPVDVVDKIATQPNDEKARPYVQQSAWYNHIDVPQLGLVSKFEQSWTTTDEWTMAEKGDADRKVKWPQWWWPHEGKLQYKPE